MPKEQVHLYSKLPYSRKDSIVVFAEPRMCNFLENLSYKECLGKKILIIGESNVGKTELTSQFLTYLRKQHQLEEIFVIEMGPPRFQLKNSTIGGQLSDYNTTYLTDPRVKSYFYSIIPPRSSATNYEEVYAHCCQNYGVLHDDFIVLVKLLLHNITLPSALVINDFSIYLHLGSPFTFLKILATPHTVVVNSYYGNTLANDYGSNISWRERMIVNLLIRHFDYVIHLL